MGYRNLGYINELSSLMNFLVHHVISEWSLGAAA
jgi:hypothetical protein